MDLPDAVTEPPARLVRLRRPRLSGGVVSLSGHEWRPRNPRVSFLPASNSVSQVSGAPPAAAAPVSTQDSHVREAHMRAQRVVVSGLTLLLAISSAVFAQPGLVKVHFGVFGGASFDKPGGADATDINGTYTGFGVGGFVGFRLTPGFAIQPEALYVQKGAKTTQSDPGGTITGKIKVPYFEIPVLAKLSIPVKGAGIVSPHAYAGPALAFKTGCHVKATQGSTSYSDRCDAANIDLRIKSTDFSLVFGGEQGEVVGDS